MQALTRIFWARWINDYVPKLIPRREWSKFGRDIMLDELVLLPVENEMKNRSWILGRVTQLVPGRDGVVRVVKVKTGSGEYTRPVARVGRLEDNISTLVKAGSVKDSMLGHGKLCVPSGSSRVGS